MVEATLHVDDKAIHRCFQPHIVPLALRGKVETELDRLYIQGVIKPAEHSDCSNCASVELLLA